MLGKNELVKLLGDPGQWGHGERGALDRAIRMLGSVREKLSQVEGLENKVSLLGYLEGAITQIKYGFGGIEYIINLLCLDSLGEGELVEDMMVYKAPVSEVITKLGWAISQADEHARQEIARYPEVYPEFKGNWKVVCDEGLKDCLVGHSPVIRHILSGIILDHQDASGVLIRSFTNEVVAQPNLIRFRKIEEGDDCFIEITFEIGCIITAGAISREEWSTIETQARREIIGEGRRSALRNHILLNLGGQGLTAIEYSSEGPYKQIIRLCLPAFLSEF